VARGANVIESDLIAALDSGHLEHTILDVFTPEPLPADHAFWQHPKITVLPHIAATTNPVTAQTSWRKMCSDCVLVNRSRTWWIALEDIDPTGMLEP
jgi:phosphoglycerate dehydrogenase-like enzyme